MLLANDGIAAARRGALAPGRRPRRHRRRCPAIMGGGSAQVTPHRLVTPLDALTEALGDGVEIVHARGAARSASRATRVGGAGAPGARRLRRSSCSPGTSSTARSSTASDLDELRLMVFSLARRTSDDWSVRVRGTVVARGGRRLRAGAGPGGPGPGAARRRGRARRRRRPAAARRHRLLRHGQPGPGRRGRPRRRGEPVEVVVEYSQAEARWPRLPGRVPHPGRRRPAGPGRRPRRPPPTSPSCSSAPAASGRRRVATGPTSTCPAARTS